jgi:hypothetical protein
MVMRIRLDGCMVIALSDWPEFADAFYCSL